MSILEFSKVPMYQFHYDYIKSKYGNKSRLLITDTDGLGYEIEIENVYVNDFRNSCVKSKYYDGSNALLLVR